MPDTTIKDIKLFNKLYLMLLVGYKRKTSGLGNNNGSEASIDFSGGGIKALLKLGTEGVENIIHVDYIPCEEDKTIPVEVRRLYAPPQDLKDGNLVKELTDKVLVDRNQEHYPNSRKGRKALVSKVLDGLVY